MITFFVLLSALQGKNVTGFDCTVFLRGVEISKKGVMIGFEPYVPLDVASKVLGSKPEIRPLDSTSASSRNLLINGDFESSLGVTSTSGTPRAVFAWASKQGACVGRYAHGATGVAQQYWPKEPGEGYFAGGNGQSPSLSQEVDLRPYKPSISGGKATFSLSAVLSGYADQADSIVLRVNWQDTSGKLISTQSVPGPTPKERGNFTKFFDKQISGVIPASATSAVVMLETNRKGGEWCDGYADNVDLRIGGLSEKSSGQAPKLGWGWAWRGGGFSSPVALLGGETYIAAKDVAPMAQLDLAFDETYHALYLDKPVLGNELVVNGGFEDGDSIEQDWETPVLVKGWKSTDRATVMRFGSKNPVGQIESWYLRGRGRRFFAGGKGEKPSISQEIDLSSWKSDLASGKVAFRGSADFGSFEGQNDGAIMTLEWLDSAGNVLGKVNRNCETYIERRYKTKFHKQLFTGKVPGGTARVRLTFVAVGDGRGVWKDGYVDNVSLKLDLR